MQSFSSTLLLAAPLARGLPCPENVRTLGFFAPDCDAQGGLLPPPRFGSLQASMDAAMGYYARSPLDLPLSHGLPPFVWATFTTGVYIPSSFDIIAGMQDGMGILGYVRYIERARSGRGGNASLALPGALALGEYLTTWANTPAQGVWGGVTRSTGLNFEWPLSTAAQGDAAFGINCIETDRVGLAGFALLRLFEATGSSNATYLAQALRNARALAAAQAPGNATDAPWPFRVDSVSGAFLNGHKNGESAFPLRLFRALSRPPYSLAEFAAPAARLWAWIRDFQLPTARVNASLSEALFVNFFEDRKTTLDNNRNSWTALELARTLIETRGEGFDPDWAAHVQALLDYALGLFGYKSGVGNVTLMGEQVRRAAQRPLLAGAAAADFFLAHPTSLSLCSSQDDDRKGWGGASSKLSAVAAMYACAGGPAWYAGLGARNAAHMAYYTAPEDGCRSAEAYSVNATPSRGGWSEDAWLDVVLNVLDAAEAAEGFC